MNPVDEDFLKRLANCELQWGELPEEHMVEMAQEILKLRERVEDLEEENNDLKLDLVMAERRVCDFAGVTYRKGD